MSDVVEIKVPDIGDFTDVPVIEVLVKPGDTIAKNDSLVVLESDKASMEVPSTVDGTVQTVVTKIGDKVSQGTLVATVAVVTGEAAGKPAPSASSFETRPRGAPQDDNTSSKVNQVEKPSTQTVNQVEKPSTQTQIPPQNIVTLRSEPVERLEGPLHASPAIRRFARDLGVALNTVRASGPNGRITREDVESYVKGALQSSAANTGGVGRAAGVSFAGLPEWPKVDFAKYGEIERKPLSRIKKLSGPNLLRNWLQIPHITNYDEADITGLEKFRQEINAKKKKKGVKLTLLAFLVKASVATLHEFPDFNSSLDGDSLILKKYHNIGFAADTPNGLVVPVIKNADTKGLIEIASESAELAAKAREGKLGLADMQGGTFTISSIGGIGGTQFTQIVNAPEVAILGATRAAMKPVWNGKKFLPRLILPISVSYDHRVIDGAAAARFLVYLAGVLRDLRRTAL